MDLIRDTAFGHLVRLLTGKRYLKYEEEESPALFRSLYTREETNPESESPTTKANKVGSSSGSSSIELEKASLDTKKSVPVEQPPPTTQLDHGDLEKAKDEFLVEWKPNDPAESFGVSTVAATLGLTLFVLGYALGPMLFSAMSEVPYIGRGPVYLGTLAVFVALQAPTAKASGFGMLMAFRFLTGFFGSPVLATGGATCADMYSPAKRAYAISIWGVAAVCGPALGPVLGGYVTEFGPLGSTFKSPWQWPIYTLMWLGAFCFVVLFFCLPETSASNILFRRAQRLRRITGNDKLISKPEIDAQQMTGREIVNMVLIHPFTLSFTEPMILLLNLYIALIYGLLYLWFEAFPIVFIEIHGFTLGQSGLAFLGILIGVLVVIPPFFWYLHRYVEPAFDEYGELQPEKRLPPCFVGAFCIPICLFWFGWSARSDVHWIMPILGSAWFSIGSFFLFIAILNYLPDAYPNHIASVLAGNDLMRSSFGAAFPLFANAMYRNLGVAWASSMLGFISIAFIPIPFVLYKYGPVLRNKYSKIAKKDRTY
ncbi:GTPase-activating protein [Elasticomyces elasticus]|nr:GTPase-activating protein [Elasticomyces elasticus]KAK4975840.1 GTPase-activating protein [Elasticomyces elasticus]